MARLPLSVRRRRINNIRIMASRIVMLYELVFVIILIWYLMAVVVISRRRRELGFRRRDNKALRMENLKRLLEEGDESCISQLRMDRCTFGVLCEMLRDISGLKGTRNTSLEEIVAMFLVTLAHHKKNRVIRFDFLRSGETVSRYFNECLQAVLKLHTLLLKKPEPISEDSSDGRWKNFKNCLGALDSTMIRVTVPSKDKVRYRTRKSDIATNVLAVCSPSMEFIYVLPGWEGSAHDARVLRDALIRPDGLKIPQGCYYLVDNGYSNCPGFLAPYRGQRYHLSEWREGSEPHSAEEYFNMKHAQARNVIERSFALLKGRWKILSSPSFFPIRTQTRIIMACCLLHNLIRRYMSKDLQEHESLYEEEEEEEDEDGYGDGNEVEYITTVQTSNEWSDFRNGLAQQMFNSWRSQDN